MRTERQHNLLVVLMLAIGLVGGSFAVFMPSLLGRVVAGCCFAAVTWMAWHYQL